MRRAVGQIELSWTKCNVVQVDEDEIFTPGRRYQLPEMEITMHGNIADAFGKFAVMQTRYIEQRVDTFDAR